MPYIAVCLVLVALLAVMPVMATESSVSLGGHTFTANLPNGWQAKSDLLTDKLTASADSHDDAIKGVGDWTGDIMFDPWYYTDNPASEIMYLKVVKIPDDLKGQDTTKILTEAAPSFNTEIEVDGLTEYPDKDISFGDRPARLAECEWYDSKSSDRGAAGRIAILLDSDTVALIYVWIDTAKSSHPNGKTWDIINSITIK